MPKNRNGSEGRRKNLISRMNVALALALLVAGFAGLTGTTDATQPEEAQADQRCRSPEGSRGCPREYVIGEGGEPDPLAKLQWGLDRVQAPRAWHYANGEGVVIAVIDTGVVRAHPDLASKWVWLREADIADPGGEDGPAAPTSGNPTCQSHGTKMAGIAAAATNNGVGIAGVAPNAKIMPVLVSICDGEAGLLDSPGSVQMAADGIRFAADHGAHVLSISLAYTATGGEFRADPKPLVDAVDYAWQRGAVIVAAAGNAPLPICELPARHPRAICVASSDFSDAPNDVSPRDSAEGNFVAAPSVGRRQTSSDRIYGATGISETCRGWIVTTSDSAQHPCDRGLGLPSGYSTGGGTSSATPHVAGIAALLISQGLGNEEVVRRIRCTADDLGPVGQDPLWGYGRVNALRAVTDDRNLGC